MEKQKVKSKNPKGTRDFSPKDVKIREYIFTTMKSVFETFGGQPIETPVFELKETLQNLYGEEFDKLVYELNDQGGEELLLRYDLTVPGARYVSNNGLTSFKKFQILKFAGISEIDYNKVSSTLDKLEKLDRKEIFEELEKKNIDKPIIDKI